VALSSGYQVRYFYFESENVNIEGVAFMIHFLKFQSLVENLLSTKIKNFQCDGGTEYKPFMRRFPEIAFRVSCPYTPEQNGLAERKQRHIMELTLATMSHASIPHEYWDDIVQSIVFLINRLPSSALAFLSPYECLFSRSPDYSFTRVLGCLCYPCLRPYAANKLKDRSLPCFWVTLPLTRVTSVFTFPQAGFMSLATCFLTRLCFLSHHYLGHLPAASPSLPSTLTIIPPPPLPTTSPPRPISPPLPPPSSLPPLPILSSSIHHMTTRSKYNTRKSKRTRLHFLRI
jgi:hypothetical protein